MEHPTPSYAGAHPFTVTRTVRWGDCDPAGIIYTPRVLDYAMEILEAWYREKTVYCPRVFYEAWASWPRRARLSWRKPPQMAAPMAPA